MIGAFFGALGLVLIVVGAAAYALWLELGLRRLTGQRFIVTVDGDIPFVGYLTHRGRRTYIFERCHTLPGPARQPSRFSDATSLTGRAS